jgi:hypothetical protein
MALGVRYSAINAVSDAIVTALNVPAVRTLCPGGVYRGLTAAQTPPVLYVGRCTERPWDTFGKSFGSLVTAQIRCETSGADANGESRAAGILSKCLELLDDVTHLTVTGWTVHQIAWNDTTMDTIAYSDGGLGYVGTATITVAVRST